MLLARRLQQFQVTDATFAETETGSDPDFTRPQALDHRVPHKYEQHFHTVEFVPGTHLASLYPGMAQATTNSEGIAQVYYTAGRKAGLVTFEAAAGLRLRNLALSLPGRGAGRVAAGEAMRWFLDAAGGSVLEEAIVLDDVEAVKVMQPIVESERRRARAVRDQGDT